MTATRLGTRRGRTPANNETRALVALPIVAVLLALASLIPATRPQMQPADQLGTLGFSYSARGAAVPSGRYPAASNLWFHDGTWWGVLFRPSRDAHVVNRYDARTATWVDTGTVVDDRNAARSDVLWDGAHAYVVSGGMDPGDTADAAILARLSFDSLSGQYSMDPGFPVRVAPSGAEAFTIDRDDTGRLWVTWTYDGRVWIRHSLADDRRWSAPTALPVPQAENLLPDDVSSVVAYDGHVGVMWSNRAAGAVYWASLAAGLAGDADWTVTAAVQGSALADSRIDLLALRNDPVGHVVAAVKTARGLVPNPNTDDPQVLVLVLGDDGTWARYVESTVGENLGSPMLALDQDHRMLYVFTSGPCCSGGTIYYKRTSLDAIRFGPGPGTPIIRRGDGSALNGPTTAKQAVTQESGLLAVASDAKAGIYMHAFITLSGPDVAGPPASPSSSPRASPGGAWLRDGFESGLMDEWPIVVTGPGSEAAVDPDQARTDAYGAHLSAGTADGAFAYARFPLPQPEQTLEAALDFRVLAEGAADSNVPLVRLLGPDGSRILSVYRQNQGRGGIWISTPDGRTETLAWIELGTWSRLDVSVKLAPLGAIVDVSLDGQFIGRGSVDVGPGIAFVQIGNEVKNQRFDIAIDNVLVAP